MSKIFKKMLASFMMIVFGLQQGGMSALQAALTDESYEGRIPFARDALDPYNSPAEIHLRVEPLHFKLSSDLFSEKQLLVRIGVPEAKVPEEASSAERTPHVTSEFIVPFDKETEDNTSDSASEASDLGSSDTRSSGSLEDLIFHATNPTDQELLTHGMMRVGQHLGMNLNGLTLVADTDGHLTLRGTVEDPRKKIFIYAQGLLRIDNVDASFLSVTAPQILNVGKSRIQRLEVSGISDDAMASTFLNLGDLRTKKFVAGHINLENQKKLSLKKASLQSEKLLNHGKWHSKRVTGDVGTIENFETLTLQNAARLHHDFLYNSGVLRSADLRTEGAVKNLGVFGVKALTLEGSALFENHGFLGAHTLNTSSNTQFINGVPAQEDNAFSRAVIETLVASGRVENFGRVEVERSLNELSLLTNGGSLTLKSGPISVEAGENRGALDIPELRVRKSFLNAAPTTPTGFLRAQAITGSGTFENHGRVLGGEEPFLLGVNTLINGGHIGAHSVETLLTCETLINEESGLLDIIEAGNFAQVSDFLNKGHIQAKDVALPGGGRNHGHIASHTVHFRGNGEFINDGEVVASGALTFEAPRFMNCGLLEAGTIGGNEILQSLVNRGDISVRDGKFQLGKTASLINEGTLEGSAFEVLGPSFHQSGTLKGKILTLGKSTLFTTTDGQKTVLKKFETGQHSDLCFKGEFQVDFFTHFGMLDLLGYFDSSDFFYAKSHIHPGAKLKGRHFSLQPGSTLKQGAEIDADSLDAPFLTLHGLARVKTRGTLGEVVIGPTGQLQGYEGHLLKVDIQKESDIAGLLDTDELHATAPLSVKEGGKLLVRAKTYLMKEEGSAEHKKSLTVRPGGTAVLHQLQGGKPAIANSGNVTIQGMSCGVNLWNAGEALLDGGRQDRVSSQLSSHELSGALSMKIANAAGKLTLRSGEFNAQGDRGFQNVGTLIQDTNASLFWTPASSWRSFENLPQKVNTGKWITTFPTLLTLGAPEDMGEMDIGGDLTVRNAASPTLSSSSSSVSESGGRAVAEGSPGTVDAIDFLDTLRKTFQKVKTSCLEIHAPSATVGSEKEYPWPIRMHIDGILRVNHTLRAPAWEVYAKKYTSAGGTFGKFIATNHALKLFVEDFENTGGRVHGKEGTFIQFSKSFRNGLRVAIPGGGNGSLLYKRHDAGIGSGRDITIRQDPRVEAALDVDNNYGLILAAGGVVDLETRGTLKSTTGLIYAEGTNASRGGEPSLPRSSRIRAKNIQLSHDQPYAWQEGGNFMDARHWGRKYLRCGHCGNLDICTGSHGWHWGTRGRQSRSSGESLVCIKGGNLLLTYETLNLNASRILCAGDIWVGRDPNLMAQAGDAQGGGQAGGQTGGILLPEVITPSNYLNVDVLKRATNIGSWADRCDPLRVVIPGHYVPATPSLPTYPGKIVSRGAFRGELGNFSSSGLIEGFSGILIEATKVALNNYGVTLQGNLAAQVFRPLAALQAEASRDRALWFQGSKVVGFPTHHAFPAQAPVISEIPAGAQVTYAVDPSAMHAWLMEVATPLLRHIDLPLSMNDLFAQGRGYLARRGDSTPQAFGPETRLVVARNPLSDQELRQAGISMLLWEVVKGVGQALETRNTNARLQQTVDQLKEDMEEETTPVTPSVQLAPVVVVAAEAKNPLRGDAGLFSEKGEVNVYSRTTYTADGSYGTGKLAVVAGGGSVQITSELDHFSRRVAYQSTPEDVVTLSKRGNVEQEATRTLAGRDIRTVAAQNLTQRSGVIHTGDETNYTQVKDPHLQQAARDIVARAEGGDITQRALEATAKRAIITDAARNVLQPGLSLHQQRVIDRKNYYSRIHSTATETGTYSAGESYIAFARGGIQDLTAPHILSPQTLIIGQGLTLRDAIQSQERTSKVTDEGDLFSDDEVTEMSSSSSTSRGALFEAPAGHPGTVKLVSASGMDLVTPNFKVSKTTLESVNGVVRILQGINTSFFQQHTKSSGLFWQSQSMEREQHKTFTSPVATGSLTIKSQETILQEVHGHALDYARKIDQQGGKITRELLHEFHDHFEESHEGPSAALGMVIALGVTLLTGGAGGGFALNSVGAAFANSVGATGLAADMIAASVAGGFSTLCSTAAVSLVQHKGNIFEAAKSFATKDSLLNLTISLMTAGLTEGVMGGFNLETAASSLRQAQEATSGISTGISSAAETGRALKTATDVANLTKRLSLLQVLGRQTIEGVSAGAVAAAVGRDLDGLDILRRIGASTLSATLCQQIGRLYGKNAYGEREINAFVHKLLHGCVGAATGAAIADDPARGAAAGALGAVVAETFADIFAPDIMDLKLEELEATLGRKVTPEEMTTLYIDRVHQVGSLAKFTGAVTALLAGQDVAPAIAAGTTAIDYNFVPMLLLGLTAASVAYEAYEVTHEFQTKGFVAGLEKLGITVVVDVALAATGAKLFQVAGKHYPTIKAALTAVLQKAPLLKAALGRTKDQILTAGEAFFATKPGQIYAHASATADAFAGRIVGGASIGIRRVIGGEGARSTVGASGKSKILLGLGERPSAEIVHVPEMKFGGGIQAQGMPFEDFIANRLHPDSRLPQNFKTYDFWDPVSRVATSVKTLDTGTAARLAKPEQVYSTLKRHIDSMAGFTEHRLSGARIRASQIASQELHLGVPTATGSAQWQQVQRAVDYAKAKNINIKIYEVR